MDWNCSTRRCGEIMQTAHTRVEPKLLNISDDPAKSDHLQWENKWRQPLPESVCTLNWLILFLSVSSHLKARSDIRMQKPKTTTRSVHFERATAEVASCCNVLKMYAHVRTCKSMAHRSTINVRRGWESGVSMRTLSIPINHNLPFKWTGQELHFPQPCSAATAEVLKRQSQRPLPDWVRRNQIYILPRDKHLMANRVEIPSGRREWPSTQIKKMCKQLWWKSQSGFKTLD